MPHLHILILAAAEGPAGPPTAWDNLRLVITKPDNIPVLLLIVLVGFYAYLALRQAFRNDRLIVQGRTKDILKNMQE